MGLITGSSGGILGLIQLIKWLKGKPKKIEKLESGDVKYTNYQDESVTVNINVDKLYQSEVIHQHFYNGYGKIFENEGIEKFESYIKESPETKTENIKDDAQAFKEYSENSLDVIADEESESTYETHLNFKRGSYEGLPDNWSFKRGDGSSITATIKDRVFLDKVKAGEIRPYAKDLLKVTLRERSKIRGTEVLANYEIINVADYKPADRNSNVRMFDETTPQEE